MAAADAAAVVVPVAVLPELHSDTHPAPEAPVAATMDLAEPLDMYHDVADLLEAYVAAKEAGDPLFDALAHLVPAPGETGAAAAVVLVAVLPEMYSETHPTYEAPVAATLDPAQPIGKSPDVADSLEASVAAGETDGSLFEAIEHVVPAPGETVAASSHVFETVVHAQDTVTCLKAFRVLVLLFPTPRLL